MSVHRIYSSKSNTVASGLYSNFNSGFNSVMNLWYGGGGNKHGIQNSISRGLLYFDFTDLQTKFNDNLIMSGNVKSYTLKMKNCVPSDSVLNSFYNSSGLIATSFDLIFFPINTYWDSGSGYDLDNISYIKIYSNPTQISGYSNWNSATTLSSWVEPGVFTNPTASTSQYSVQHFNVGNEDIEVDITSIVQDWLSGGSVNNGLGIAYANPYEAITSDTRYISAFFNQNTNTAYQSFIEVDYSQTISDDRLQFSNQRTNRLFLFTYSGNQPTNYYSANTVVLTDSNDNILGTYSPTQFQQGVYYVDVYLPNLNIGDRINDTWSGITFVPGYDQQNFCQFFDVKSNYYSSNVKGNNQYSLKTYGIENNDIIDYDGIIRVYVETTINFSNNNAYILYGLSYHLTMNVKDEIIPWTPANYTKINNSLTYFFDIDTSWLLSNQSYTINFMINEIGTSRVVNENIYFKVLKNNALQ